ncbi:MAG: Ig-like domain-containing protein [Chitinophagaceae bacterium]
MKKLLPVICLWLIAACSKKDGTAADTAVPGVVINSPANGQVFTGGATVTITAAITDDTRLTEVHVHILDNTTSQLLIDIHRYPNTAAYTLNETFQAQSGINYTIKVIAVDRSGKTGTQTVLVSVN